MTTYGWYPLNTSNPLAYTWSPTGNWSNGADWGDLASTSFPPSTGTVPGPGDTAYIVSANALSSFIPSPYPAPPYNVDITINTAQSVGALGMAVYEPFAFLGITATLPVIDVAGASFFVTGSIVDNFTATFPKPIGTQTFLRGGTINLASSASLEVGTTIDAGITVHFNDGSDKVILDGLNSTDPTAVMGQFSNFQAGDIINLSNVAAGAKISNYNIFSGALTISTGATVDAVVLVKGTGLTLSSFSLRPDSASGLDIVTCFAEGTRILTPFGETAVEALTEGDLVTIQDPRTGAKMTRPVRWIGRRRINLRRHRQPELASPIRIRRNACGDGLPQRDLLVSPDHALLLDGVLIPARLLVNGASIAQETDLPEVQYFHIELDCHAIVLAEGMPAESYLDTGNRASFENAGTPLALHPDFSSNTALSWSGDACAELAVEPSAIEPVWRRLAERATALGFSVPETTPLAAEAAPWLEVNGEILRATTLRPGHHLFALPAHLQQHPVALRSDATRPSDRSPWLNDRRCLGIAVERILLHRAAEIAEIPLDHPALAAGWWQTERDASRLWRWTDGNSALPALAGAHMIEIRTAGASLARTGLARAGMAQAA